MGVNIEWDFDVMRLGLVSQAFSAGSNRNTFIRNTCRIETWFSDVLDTHFVEFGVKPKHTFSASQKT